MYSHQQYVLQQPQGMGVAYPMMATPMGVHSGGVMYQPHPVGIAVKCFRFYFINSVGGYIYYQQPHLQTSMQQHGQVPIPSGLNPILQAPQTQTHPQATPTQEQIKSLEEQKREMAEQMRQKEIEEQKKKEIEKQKKRLQDVSIKNPPSSLSSIETLIGFNPTTTSIQKPSAKITHTKVTAPSIETTPLKETETAPPPIITPITTVNNKPAGKYTCYYYTCVLMY